MTYITGLKIFYSNIKTIGVMSQRQYQNPSRRIQEFPRKYNDSKFSPRYINSVRWEEETLFSGE